MVTTKRVPVQRITKSGAIGVAVHTEDAFSFGRYGRGAWLACAIALAGEGLTGKQIEAVLRSNWMRIAADENEPAGKPTAKHLLAYIEDRFGSLDSPLGARALDRLVKGNFGISDYGADMAGSCEGEDIADLIDFARAVRDETDPSGERVDGDRHLAILRDRARRILDRIELRAQS